jgi:hypothetical protein
MAKKIWLIFIVLFLFFIDIQVIAGGKRKKKKRKAKLERILNKYDYILQILIIIIGMEQFLEMVY